MPARLDFERGGGPGVALVLEAPPCPSGCKVARRPVYHHPDYGPVTFDDWLYGKREVKNCPVDELTGGDQ